jgi:hypothetical protein
LGIYTCAVNHVIQSNLAGYENFSASHAGGA